MRTQLRRLTLGVAAAAISMGGLVAIAPTASAHVDCDYTSYDHRPTLRPGSSDSAAVMQLQCMIDTYSKYGSLDENDSRFLDHDGKFGRLTEKAVVNIQRCEHIDQDGVVGPQTWAKLYDIPNQHGC